MKTTLRNAVLVAGGILLSVGGTAQASTSTELKANVPFPFVINGQNLPAGKYDIERDDFARVLLIRNENSKQAVIVEAIPEYGQQPANSRPVLTFTRHENQYQLTGVRESTGDGWDLIGR
jgi:hypothetical protein